MVVSCLNKRKSMHPKRTVMFVFIFVSAFIVSGIPQYATGEVKPRQDDRPGEIMTVKTAIGNVRRGPALTFPVTGKLRKGDKVKVTGKKDKWCMIRFHGGRVGWAHESLFFKARKTRAAGTRMFKQIKEIRFKTAPEGGEMVIFRLNGYSPPKIFTLDEGRPRVVCDFFDTSLGAGVGRLIEVNGQVVRNIRIGIYNGPVPKVRVVSDLVSQEDSVYEIRPVFFKDENIYTLTIKRVPKE